MKHKLTKKQEELLTIGDRQFIRNPETEKMEQWSFLPYWFKTDDQGNTYEMIHLDRLPEYVKRALEEVRNKKY